jgi:rhodanese-related sulfurtransferase
MTEKKIAEITPLRAWEVLRADKSAVLLDVRTPAEFEYVGRPLHAVNVPWQAASPGFVDNVRNILRRRAGDMPPEDRTVLAICRSGKRSLAAATALADQGFKHVYNVAEGFEGELDAERHRGNINGWRFHKLPWVQD